MAVTLVGTNADQVTVSVPGVVTGDTLIAVNPGSNGYPPVDTGWAALSVSAAPWEWKIATASTPPLAQDDPDYWLGLIALRGAGAVVANSPPASETVAASDTVTIPAVSYSGGSAYELVMWAATIPDESSLTVTLPAGFTTFWESGRLALLDRDEVAMWGFLGREILGPPAAAVTLTTSGGDDEAVVYSTQLILDVQAPAGGSSFVG